MATTQKIAINTLFMVPNESGGTEYHLRSTLKYLEKMDKEHPYLVFCNLENYSTFHFKSPLWQKICCSVQGANKVSRVVYEQLVLPKEIKRHHCSVVHSFGYTGLLFSDLTQVVTVHDVNWLDYPEDMAVIGRLVVKFLAEQSVQKADYVLTDSRFSQARLHYHFPNLDSKVVVISPGLDEDFFPTLSRAGRPSLPKEAYLFSVNAFYPHKKVLYLLNLWQKIQANLPNLYLVLVGQHGLEEDAVLQKIKSLDRILYYPKVAYSELISFYKYAQACIMPSVYEGFGYPVYEAVAAGKEVFVGQKDLYDHSIVSSLHQLSFDLGKDSKMIQAFLNSSEKKVATVKSLSYKPGVEKLIQLYNSIT